MIIFNRKFKSLVEKVEWLEGRLSGVPEHSDMVGVPSLRFSRTWQDGVWRCVVPFNDDVDFLVDAWFKYDEDKAMDAAKLKRKIERALYDR